MESQGCLKKAPHSKMSEAVKRNIEEAKDTAYLKRIEDNNVFSFFKSTSKTLIQTGVDMVTGGALGQTIALVDAFRGVISEGKEVLDVQSVRWQGFVVDSKRILRKLD